MHFSYIGHKVYMLYGIYALIGGPQKRAAHVDGAVLTVTAGAWASFTASLR